MPKGHQPQLLDNYKIRFLREEIASHNNVIDTDPLFLTLKTKRHNS